MAVSLQSRVEAYRQSWNSRQLDRLLSHWVDDGLDYSDYLTQQIHMDKGAAKKVFGGMLSLCGDIDMVSRNLSGTTNSAVWEADINFTCLADFPGSPFKKGDRAKTVGVSLIEWNSEGKIFKQSDYYCWSNSQ
ncbi:hypothetical protein AK830_g4358 [Neonectria ditissima]|uniref:SnoaL-like domain-containing protein n=2 Tax=Eukaryota TaxID=2759 RepID=A0A0P7BP39_9HYPO|nr:hypothetical protein AK830_g4358 [Neonectria ditissima]